MTLGWPRLVWGKVSARIHNLETRLAYATAQWNRWRDAAEYQAAQLAEFRHEVESTRAALDAIAPIPDPQPVAEAVRSLTGGPRTSADVPDWIARAREQGW